MQNKIVIFAPPRSGTKLLSDILGQFGYHQYGEWYNTWTNVIQDNRSVRASKEFIKTSHSNGYNPKSNFTHSMQTIDRLLSFDNEQKAVITIWQENLEAFPFITTIHNDWLWILPIREEWDNLVSWIVSGLNQNFDAEYKSEPVTVARAWFDHFYWKRKKIEILRQWMIENIETLVVPFNELINGTFNGFGKQYTVNTIDEHSDPESLILNLSEIKQWYQENIQSYDQLGKLRIENN